MTLTLEARKQRASTLKGREARLCPTTRMEVREADGALTLVGYASIFDVPYDLGWYTETIRSGAFAKTLAGKPDVQLLVNHMGLPLARTSSGTMRLEEDAQGLRVEADLDPEDRDVENLVRKMERGDIDEMSFAFWTVRAQWDEDYEKRELLEVKIDRGDVSVVNYGANPHTSVQVRSVDLLAQLAALDPAEALAEVRSGGEDMVQMLTEARDRLGSMVDELKPAPETLGLYLARAKMLDIA